MFVIEKMGFSGGKKSASNPNAQAQHKVEGECWGVEEKCAQECVCGCFECLSKFPAKSLEKSLVTSLLVPFEHLTPQKGHPYPYILITIHVGIHSPNDKSSPKTQKLQSKTTSRDLPFPQKDTERREAYLGGEN